MTPVRGVLLDALGTLVGLKPPAPALRAALGTRGVEVDDEGAAAAMAAEIAFYRAHLGAGRDAAAVAQLRRRCAAVLRDALPSHVRAQPLEVIHESLLEALRFEAFPDVRPALQALREDGRRLVVVSNWDFSLHEVLREVALAPDLDAVVTSAEVGAAKPAGAIFAAGLARAGVSAAEALHVGDSPAEDVAGARAAGIEPVLVVRGDDGFAAGASGAGSVPAGVRVIAGLGELVEGSA